VLKPRRLGTTDPAVWLWYDKCQIGEWFRYPTIVICQCPMLEGLYFVVFLPISSISRMLTDGWLYEEKHFVRLMKIAMAVVTSAWATSHPYYILLLLLFIIYIILYIIEVLLLWLLYTLLYIIIIFHTLNFYVFIFGHFIYNHSITQSLDWQLFNHLNGRTMFRAV
jgi:hypothetical protein